MGIESALAQWEYKCWCDYNHEHINENGEWVNDEDYEEKQRRYKADAKMCLLLLLENWRLIK